MKKTKKIFSLLLAMLMLLTVMPITSQADTALPVEGKYKFRQSLVHLANGTSSTTTENAFIEPTDTVRYGSKGCSAHLYNKQEVGGVWHELATLTLALDAANSYNVEFLVKGENRGPIAFCVYNNRQIVEAANWNITDAGDGWYKYSKQNLTGMGNANYTLRFWTAADMYVDNFKISDANTGELKYYDPFDYGFVSMINDTADDAYSFNKMTVEATSAQIAEKGTFIEPTDRVSYNGKMSAHFYMKEDVAGQQIHLLAPTKFNPDTNVKIEFYTTSSSSVYLIWSHEGNGILQWESINNGTYMGNGWWKHSLDTKVVGLSRLGLRFWAPDDFYIDDFKISDASGNVLFFDDFESSVFKKAENKYSFDKMVAMVPDWNAQHGAFIEPIDRFAHAGTHSAYFYNPAAGPNTQLHLVTPDRYNPGTVLNVEFYTTKISQNFLLWSYDGNAGLWDHQLNKTDAGNGWYKWTAQFTVTGWSRVGLRFWNPDSFYVDDFKISDTNNNVLFSDDFESVTKIRTGVINFLATPDTDNPCGLKASWKNPDVGTIESYKLYMDGTEYNCTPDLTAGAFNVISIPNLVVGREYTFKLAEKIAGKDAVEYTTKGTPDAYGVVANIGDWSLERKSQSDFRLAQDNGSTVMKMYTNFPKANGQFPSFRQKITLNADTDYDLSFKAKFENVNWFTVMMQYSHKCADGTTGGTSHRFEPIANGYNLTNIDWKTYTDTLDGIKCDKCGKEFYSPYTSDGSTYEVELIFLTDSAEGCLSFDDIAVRPKDPFGGTYGDNVVRNGDFELTYSVLEPEYYLVSGEEETPITSLQAGKVNVSARIKNYTMNNFAPCVIFALYDGTTLKDSAVAKNKSMNATSAFIPADEFTAQFDIPALDSGDYKIKIFYWDGMDTINPISESDFITE